MMSGFALFRMPYASECTLISGEVIELDCCEALTGQQGFVVAPFAPSPKEPLLVIKPERIEVGESSLSSLSTLSTLSSLSSLSSPYLSSGHRNYHTDFEKFHEHLLNGDFQKLVLSRSMDMILEGGTVPQQLFQKACDSYPRLFVSLVYTPQSGLWLTATPETLLSGKGQEWHTIALAGTMTYEEYLRWSDKNIREQRYVASYMTRQLEVFSNRIVEEGPRTARAGHLAHLRSDFHFMLDDESKVGALLQALHPTPAVCGLPKEDAFRFILQNEHHDRSYYSGFMGPFFVDGQTNLFVTLRCMQLFHNGCRLYAGGGLLKESVEEQEWLETETKLDTMRHILFAE
jgi:isochorismate synthase